VSLRHSMLPPEMAARVVNTVERELLTPYGLRTLARGDPNYRGRYEGDQRSRDEAYHQGSVWPWLMGPFVDAFLRTGGARGQVKDWLAPFEEYMRDEGVGQVPEVFDGDAPHRSGGCVAQAWSVGELLRVAIGFAEGGG
jgi:glycogen debranching enzyme